MIKKDDRFYTFVISRSSKNRLFVRRIEIPKRWFQTTISAIILSLCATSYSFYGLTNNVELAQENFSTEQSIQIIQNFNSQFGEGGPDEATINAVEPNEAENSALYAKIRGLEDKLNNTADVPSIYPLVGKINNEFGWRSNPFGGRSTENHPGMDIDGDKGDIIIAPADGVVLKAGWQGGYGNLIEISHGNGLTTRYGHLSQIEVEIGGTVVRGQEIGRVGSTGRSTGPHLHYEVRQENQAINPRGYLPPNPLESIVN